MYIVIAILAFGILIALHELGHFTAAKLLGVRVNEYSIGMGPAIWKRQGKETQYSLRLLPLGGYCAMEGEDGKSDDPKAFTNKAFWRRLIILVAGSFMNFLAGFVVIVILFSSASYLTTTTVTGFMDGFPAEGEHGLMAGDTILSIDGEPIRLASDFSTFLARGNGETADVVVLREGKRVRLEAVPLALREYETEGGTVLKYGVYFGAVKATLGQKLKYSFNEALDFVRLVRIGLSDLIGGNAGVKDLSGPVGIVSMINEVGTTAETPTIAAENIAYLCAFIAINLAVMNLLPIPALDGGRIFFLIVTVIAEKIMRRRINPKYEGYVHAAGLVLLMGLMVFVMFNDIVRLING